MKRWLLALLVVACNDPQGPQGPPKPIAPPPVARDASPPDAPARFIGVLTAAESVDLAPRSPGLIKAVRFNIGDTVSLGDVVVEMDPIQLEDELRAAEAALAAATAASRQASVDVEDARRKLKLETEAVKAGVSPTQNVEEARLALKRAQAAAERARSTQAAEAARTQAAREHVSSADLRAPFAGTVAMRYREAGNRAEAGAAIVRIVGQGKMRLRFAVPPELARPIAPGIELTATIDTITAPVRVVVKQVSPTIDPPSGMIVVEAELEGAGNVQPGLAAWVDPPR